MFLCSTVAFFGLWIDLVLFVMLFCCDASAIQQYKTSSAVAEMATQCCTCTTHIL